MLFAKAKSKLSHDVAYFEASTTIRLILIPTSSCIDLELYGHKMMSSKLVIVSLSDRFECFSRIVSNSLAYSPANIHGISRIQRFCSSFTQRSLRSELLQIRYKQLKITHVVFNLGMGNSVASCLHAFFLCVFLYIIL